MNWIDYAILGLTSISLIIGIFRGLVKEVISLLTWLLASWLSVSFSADVSQFLSNIISNSNIRIVAAFALIFIIIFMLGAFITYLLRLIIDKIGLTSLDRLAGAVFGAVRGIVIIVIIVMLASLTPAKEQTIWQTSILLPHFNQLSTWLHQQLPQDIKNINVSSQIQQLQTLQP